MCNFMGQVFAAATEKDCPTWELEWDSRYVVLATVAVSAGLWSAHRFCQYAARGCCALRY